MIEEEDDLFQFVFILIIFITGCSLVFFSVLSRRQNIESKLRYRYRAQMNISMGICFLAWAGLQLTLPSTHTLRYFLIGLILVIGLINLYYGMKRYRWVKNNLA